MKNSDSNKPKCKYYCYDVFPARIFFQIRETGNYQLMRPKPKVSTTFLQKLFMQVYDDYFIKTDNKDAARYLELLELTERLKAKEAAFKMILQFHWETLPELWNHPLIVEVRTQQITELNKHMEYPFDLQSDFDSEMQSALTQTMGFIGLELSEAEMELEDLRKRAEKNVFEFDDSLQQINEANGQQYGADLLLPQYVAAEKSAIKKSEKQRLRQLAR